MALSLYQTHGQQTPTHYPDWPGRADVKTGLYLPTSPSSDVHFSPEEMADHAFGCMSAIKAALESCTKKKVTPLPSAHLVSTVFWSCLARCLARSLRSPSSLDDGVGPTTTGKHIWKTSVWMPLSSATSHMNPSGSICLLVKAETGWIGANHYRVLNHWRRRVSRALLLHHTHHCPQNTNDKGGYVLWCGSVSWKLPSSPGYRLGWCYREGTLMALLNFLPRATVLPPTHSVLRLLTLPSNLANTLNTLEEDVLRSFRVSAIPRLFSPAPSSRREDK